MKRALALLLSALLLCLCASGCTPMGRRMSATKIVNENLNDITDLAEKILETGKTPEDAFFVGVEKIDYAPPDWVGFQTGSREEDGETALCGFYYSRSDRAMGYRGEDMELTADGSGYSWQDDAGQRSYYTERFQFSWFYYEIYESAE